MITSPVSTKMMRAMIRVPSTQYLSGRRDTDPRGLERPRPVGLTPLARPMPRQAARGRLAPARVEFRITDLGQRARCRAGKSPLSIVSGTPALDFSGLT